MPAIGSGEYMEGMTSMICRDSTSIVAQIALWNYLLKMMAWKLGPIIGGGDTEVNEPWDQTGFTALKMAKILAEELPEAVVNVLVGQGETVGSRLTQHPTSICCP